MLPSIQPGPQDHILSLVNEETNWKSGLANVGSSGTPGFLVDDGTVVNRRDIELNDLQPLGQATPNGVLTNDNGTVEFTTGNDGQVLKFENGAPVFADFDASDIAPGNVGEILTTVNTVNGPEASWEPASGAAVNIYNSDGTLTGNRSIDADGFDLTIDNIGDADFQVNKNGTAGTKVIQATETRLGMTNNNAFSGKSQEVTISNSEVLIADSSLANSYASIAVNGDMGAMLPNGLPGGVSIRGNNIRLLEELTIDNTITDLVTINTNGILARRELSSIGGGNNIYNADGALTNDRLVDVGSENLRFQTVQNGLHRLEIDSDGIVMQSNGGSLGIESRLSCSTSISARDTHPTFGVAEVVVQSNSVTAVAGNDPGGVTITGNNLWIPTLTQDDTLSELVVRGAGGALQSRDVGSLPNLYNSDGVLTSNRLINANGFNLIAQGLGDAEFRVIKNGTLGNKRITAIENRVAMSNADSALTKQQEVSIYNDRILIKDESTAGSLAEILVNGDLPAVAPNVNDGGLQIRAQNVRLLDNLTVDNTETDFVTINSNGVISKRELSSLVFTSPISAFTSNAGTVPAANTTIQFPDLLANQMGISNVAGVFSGFSGLVEIQFTCNINDIDINEIINVGLRNNGLVVTTAVRRNAGTGAVNAQIVLTTLINNPGTIDVRITSVSGSMTLTFPVIKFYQR